MKMVVRKMTLFAFLLISFSITRISLFGQVDGQKGAPRELISNISSIVESDAKTLDSIFSIAFEVINNYQIASAELDKARTLLDYFSISAKRKFGSEATFSELEELKMTNEELGAEIVNRIGLNSCVDKIWNGDHRFGFCSKKNAKKMQAILLQEIEPKKIAYSKAEKILEENVDIIDLIPPDYRYPLALSTMHRLVRNYRASTWKESVDLYEEQYHRWIMETNSTESVKIQTEIRNLTKYIATRSPISIAIFTGLIYLKL